MLEVLFYQYRAVAGSVWSESISTQTTLFPPSLSSLSQVDRPIDDIEEEEGEGEEGSCIEVDAFGSSRYDGFRWWGFLVGFILGLEGPRHFNWFTVTVKVGKFEVSR